MKMRILPNTISFVISDLDGKTVGGMIELKDFHPLIKNQRALKDAIQEYADAILFELTVNPFAMKLRHRLNLKQI